MRRLAFANLRTSLPMRAGFFGLCFALFPTSAQAHDPVGVLLLFLVVIPIIFAGINTLLDWVLLSRIKQSAWLRALGAALKANLAAVILFGGVSFMLMFLISIFDILQNAFVTPLAVFFCLVAAFSLKANLLCKSFPALTRGRAFAMLLATGCASGFILYYAHKTYYGL